MWLSELVTSTVGEQLERLTRKANALTAELAQLRARVADLERTSGTLTAESAQRRREVETLRCDVRGLAVSCEILGEDVRRVLEPEVEAGS